MSGPQVVLVVGGGGREHALARALAQPGRTVIVAPGNPGMRAPLERAPANSIDGWVQLAQARGADLVVVGPEAPLASGLADALAEANIPCFGPKAAAARLEASKAFAKQVMEDAGVPTARGRSFTELEPALAFARSLPRVVVKADGLAAGKGVLLPENPEQTESAVRSLLGGDLGDAGRTIVVEEHLEGEEVSILAICDGIRAVLLVPAQDHKRVGEGDTGPNTGGMGAYAPAPIATPQLLEEARVGCVQPVVDAMRARGTPFVGVLYAGLMVTQDGPRVLEYNVRFGDPEAQVVLPLVDGDVGALLLAAARGRLDSVPPLVLRSGAAATVVMASEGYPNRPETGRVVEGTEAFDSEEVWIDFAGVSDDGGRLVTSGGRVLAVTARGADLSEALARCYGGIDRVRFQGAHVRRDIGRRALDRGS